MKMLADYLEHAQEFERLAIECTDTSFKQQLLNQAEVYRNLASDRADLLKLRKPSEPPQSN